MLTAPSDLLQIRDYVVTGANLTGI
jgi:hypothetical protein